MIVPVMAISNLVLTQQIYSEETNGARACAYSWSRPFRILPIVSKFEGGSLPLVIGSLRNDEGDGYENVT